MVKVIASAGTADPSKEGFREDNHQVGPIQHALAHPSDGRADCLRFAHPAEAAWGFFLKHWKYVGKVSRQKARKDWTNMDGVVKAASRRPKTNLQMCQVGPKWCLGRQRWNPGSPSRTQEMLRGCPEAPRKAGMVVVRFDAWEII